VGTLSRPGAPAPAARAGAGSRGPASAPAARGTTAAAGERPDEPTLF
jgi:hypothetical protein